LVRHLLLPEDLAGTWETLCFIALELSPSVSLSLMSQYRPVHKALLAGGANFHLSSKPSDLGSNFSDEPLLNREITSEEYESAISMARELGFESLYLQSMERAVHNLPDFDNTENPFPLDRTHNQENAKAGQL